MTTFNIGPAVLQWAWEKLSSIVNNTTGSIQNTINTIEEIWEMDCEGDWVLYVKTALVGVGSGLYLLLTPSLDEVLENYLEPKPGRRKGDGAGNRGRDRLPVHPGQRRVFFRGGFPDIDQAIASMLPGRNVFAGRQVGPGEWLFWTSINTADRIAWYWLLAEATETFATKWISGLAESGRCSQLADGYLQTRTPVRNGDPGGVMWTNVNNNTNTIAKEMKVSNNGETKLKLDSTVAHQFAAVDGAFTVTNNNPTEPATRVLRLRIWGVSGVAPPNLMCESKASITVQPGGSATVWSGGTGFDPFANAVQFKLDLVDSEGPGPTDISYVHKAACIARDVRVL